MSEPSPGRDDQSGEHKPTHPVADESANAASVHIAVPVAQIRQRTSITHRLSGGAFSRLWLLTAACAFIAVMLVVSTYRARGVRIVVRFQEGHGLKAGDHLRHRGIDVGEVTAVQLDPQGQGIHVTIQLHRAAEFLARDGSRFWIERPQVSLSRVRGLETVVGPKYVAVDPGPESDHRRYSFEGLTSAPILLQRVAGGLDIVLESDHRLGVESGAPVTYRGVQVGTIVSIGLAADAASVESHAYVEPAYRALIRDNTQFWSSGGIDVNLGLSGLQVNADTLATIASGGVTFATPDEAGAAVATGHRFKLVRRPADESQWLNWKPRLPVGSAPWSTGIGLPQPLRATLTWKKRTLGVRRTQERQGWVLPVAGDELVGPADLFLPPDDAMAGSAHLEVAGSRLSLASNLVQPLGKLARFTALLPESARSATWSVRQCRVPRQPEDSLLVTGHRDGPMPLAAARFTSIDDRWLIDAALPIDPDAHGACIVASADGAVIGLLSVEKKDRYILPLTPESVRPPPERAPGSNSAPTSP